MKYAVVAQNSKQYKVEEGQELLIDGYKNGREIEFGDVLLIVDDAKVKIGKPKIAGAKVTAKILGQEKGKKIDVVKYKAKSRYRRHLGFRPQYTRIKIDKIYIL